MDLDALLLLKACKSGNLADVQRYADVLRVRKCIDPFITACFNNHVRVVEWLATEFPWVLDDVNWPKFQYTIVGKRYVRVHSPFLYACVIDNSELAQCLLRLRPGYLDVTMTEPYGNTGMHVAFRSGSVRVAQMLNERDPTLLGRRNHVGYTPFWHACIFGRCTPELISALFRAFRPDPLERAPDGSGRTLLHEMCRVWKNLPGSVQWGVQWSVFKCLVKDLGFPINVQSWSGRTPLQEVTWNSLRDDVVVLGGRDGVDEATFLRQWKNLVFACKNDDVTMLETVRDTMDDTWIVGFTVGDKSAILDASRFNSARVVTALCEMGADWDSPTPGAAIHVAVEYGSIDVARVLCNMGADVHARNDKGQTPIEVARERGSADMETLLREYGAS